MGTSSRRAFCGLLFWLKVLLSLFLTFGTFKSDLLNSLLTYTTHFHLLTSLVGVLAYFIYEVVTMRITALQNPIAKPFSFVPGSPQCAATRSAFARLEPPSSKMLFGFQVNPHSLPIFF